MNHIPDNRPYRVAFSPVELEVVRAVTVERIHTYQQFKLPIPKADVTLMKIPDKRPYIDVRPEGIAVVGRRLLDYGNDTELTTKKIVKYTQSDEISQPMVANRQRLGTTALQYGEQLVIYADVLTTLELLPEIPETLRLPKLKP